MSGQPLTLLYVPADRPDRVAKALASPADVVLVDLEDAVAPSRKVEARENAVGLLGGVPGGGVEAGGRAGARAVQVRINHPATPWHAGDVAALAALPRRVGMHRAKELTLLTDIIDATEADRIGLVNRVVPDAELDAFVDDWATRLAAGPPIALAQSKRLLNNAIGSTLEQALDEEGAAQTVNFSTKDTAEAVSAFLDKRTPTFQGR